MHFAHKTSVTLALLTVSGFSLLPASAQNLVTNPGFETGSLMGYTFSGSVVLALGPHTGTYAAGFTGQTPPSLLSQNIATVAGDTYNVSFFLWNRANISSAAATNEFQASFAGFQGVDLINAAAFDYKQFSFTATASGPTSTLQFAVPKSGSFWLDDLSVTDAGPAAVPEAASVVSLGVLLALGLGGAAVRARRRNAAAAV